MQSVLPPALEQKRLAIARIHNRLVGLCILVLFGGVAALVFLNPGRRDATTIGSWGFGLLLLEGYAIYRIFQYDQVLSHRLGFLCPHCGGPLYEPRLALAMTGNCPKCGKSVIA